MDNYTGKLLGNRYLLEKGAISQNDYAKMAEKITIRSARLSHKSANKSS